MSRPQPRYVALPTQRRCVAAQDGLLAQSFLIISTLTKVPTGKTPIILPSTIGPWKLRGQNPLDGGSNNEPDQDLIRWSLASWRCALGYSGERRQRDLAGCLAGEGLPPSAAPSVDWEQRALNSPESPRPTAQRWVSPQRVAQRPSYDQNRTGPWKPSRCQTNRALRFKSMSARSRVASDRAGYNPVRVHPAGQRF